MAYDCLSVGVLVADHLCAPISHLPRAGELVLSDELPLAIGGCAANAAIDLARLGVSVGVVGCVGDDAFGSFIRQTLGRHGVGVEGLRQIEGVGTSGTLIINVRGEDRRFIHTLGANARLLVEHIDWSSVSQARVLYLGGYLLMPALEPAPLAELFRRARAHGVRTVLDVVLPGPGDHWPKLAPLLPHTDVFLPNNDEAEVLTGLADPVDQARYFAEHGVATSVITCGHAGTVLWSEAVKARAGTYPVEFVGGTGAGDAFDAGYIAALLQGHGPLDCLRWGSALGASCVRAIGATEGVFSAAEAAAFLRKHDLPIERL